MEKNKIFFKYLWKLMADSLSSNYIVLPTDFQFYFDLDSMVRQLKREETEDRVDEEAPGINIKKTSSEINVVQSVIEPLKNKLESKLLRGLMDGGKRDRNSIMDN